MNIIDLVEELASHLRSRNADVWVRDERTGEEFPISGIDWIGSRRINIEFRSEEPEDES